MSAGTADAALAAGRAQARAAAPGWSAWVAANAGSGKTRVLTARVARLLLGGAEPERILCLTFTKAAAAEMTNRLTDLLGAWALMEDAPLRAALTEMMADEPDRPLDAPTLAAARRLFAKALETPGGLRIQTIHAFCDSVLRRFPLEAGVSPDFEVIDDAEKAAMAGTARDRLAEDAAAGRDDAFDAVAAHLTDEGLDDLIAEILAKRALFADPPDAARLAAEFGLSEGDFDADPLAGLLSATDRADLRAAADLLAAGSKSDAATSEKLARAARADGDAETAAALADLCLTQKGEARSLRSTPTKTLNAAHPWIRERLAALADRLLTALERAHAVAACRRAIDLNRFGARLLALYEAEKRARGALDYDDLVEATGRLFAESERAAWALYKLDGGVDHLLVDEAQDTAPAQWAVIEALTAEFFAGEGAREAGRTVFVVGDEKQSIYSFQGAEPGIFGEKRAVFADRARAAGEPFGGDLALATSFRSAPAILRVVDAVFGLAPEGLTALGAPPQHVAALRDRPGCVDLWPILGRDEAADDPDWTEPVDAPAPADPKLRLARLLADEIARWLRESAAPPCGGAPIRPGDVMVLVRRRDLLAAELVRALKRRAVPVAGADRLTLADDLAVRDLLALARFALTPGDDLTLAALLRSPLCGVSEAALFDLAHPRAGRLWDALRAARDRHPETVALLERARRDADFLRPYEFLDRILTVEGGRKRLLARLGTEAEDPIDALLAQALAYESRATPTLEGFLDHIERGDTRIKREMDKGAGEVRVMTVHGAKGLESRVVILPDTVARTGGRRGPLLRLPRQGAPWAAWRAPAGEAPRRLREAQEAAERLEREESRRLLYVAMTRAERWLIVCGAGRPQGETWHALVEAGMEASDAVAIDPPAGGEGCVRRVLDPEPEPAGEGADAPRGDDARPPAWAAAAPPPAPEPPPRGTPSDLGGVAGDAAGGLRDAETARRRGEAIHMLLERLPEEAPADRPTLGAALLDAFAPGFDAAARGAMLDEALTAMAAPETSALFGAEALAEAAFSVEIAGIGRVAGRMDRVLLDPGSALAIDFKTDAAPPETPAAVPDPYLRQMAAYREALRALHPDRTARVALLWTATPRLMTLPDALLDMALARARAS